MTCAWSATQCAFVMMRLPSTTKPEPVLSRCCFVCHGINQLGLAATVYTLMIDPYDCSSQHGGIWSDTKFQSPTKFTLSLDMGYLKVKFSPTPQIWVTDIRWLAPSHTYTALPSLHFLTVLRSPASPPALHAPDHAERAPSCTEPCSRVPLGGIMPAEVVHTFDSATRNKSSGGCKGVK